MRARAYFQTLGRGTIMNNFPHMLKIISLCSAPHTLCIWEERVTLLGNGRIFLYNFCYWCLFFFSPTAFSSSRRNIWRWKINLKIVIGIHLGCLISQFGSQNITPQDRLKGSAWNCGVLSLSLEPVPLVTLFPCTSRKLQNVSLAVPSGS